LLILEAMKMENEIVAPSDGTVASINVAGGASVNAGDLLVTLD
jgi:biotin carboxyl carrier protein